MRCPHRHETHIDVLLQKVHPPFECAPHNRRLEMNVEVELRTPVLIENEQVRIVVANVKVIVDAALFRAGRLHEFAHRGKKLVALLGLALQKGDERNARINFRSSLSELYGSCLQ
jgi:hypothetical protein